MKPYARIEPSARWLKLPLSSGYLLFDSTIQGQAIRQTSLVTWNKFASGRTM
jgi:hypothetical protein